LSVATQF